MKIIINGEEKSLDGTISVEELVNALRVDRRKVAIEVNLRIISKSEYASTFINEGDRVEIVHFIAGG